MSDFKTKMHQFPPNSISARAPPQTPLGELTALPQTPYLDFGALLLRGEGEKGREGKGKARQGKRRGLRTPPQSKFSGYVAAVLSEF